MIAKFTVIIDSREQRSWFFEGITKEVKGVTHKIEVPTMVRGLKTGDYSIDGYEDKICVERKSVQDLIGTITRGRDRFQNELERMQAMDFSAVIVEGTWEKTLKQCFSTTRMNPVSLDSSMTAFMMRFPRTHWMFRPGRFAAMKTAYKIFDIYLRRIVKYG